MFYYDTSTFAYIPIAAANPSAVPDYPSHGETIILPHPQSLVNSHLFYTEGKIHLYGGTIYTQANPSLEFWTYDIASSSWTYIGNATNSSRVITGDSAWFNGTVLYSYSGYGMCP